MYKRHFMFHLIGVRHCITLIALLTLIIGTQHVSAQSQLAQDAYAIFEASCLKLSRTLTAPIERHSSWNTPRSSKRAPSFPETLIHPSCINVCLEPLKMAAHRCRSDNHPLPPQSIDTDSTLDSWLALPIGRRLAVTDGRFISPGEVLNTIEAHINTHSNRLIERLPVTSHLLISTTQARRSRYSANTAKRSPNLSIAYHGEVGSSTHNPSTRKPLSSTSTYGTTSGIEMTAGRR